MLFGFSRRDKKAGKRDRFRHLLVQMLEDRVVYAADVSPLQNPIYSADVDGDYRLTPLDALHIINHLNSGSPRSVGEISKPSEPYSTRNDGLWLDVDGDQFITPLDALNVIQLVNRGEGIGELVQVKYEFYAANPDGSIGRNLDPNPNDTTQEGIIGKGERFIVRTLMADVRPSPAGIYSAYHDLIYKNADGKAVEKIELQWSEFNSLVFERTEENALVSGSFALSFGSLVTKPIDYAIKSPRPGVIVSAPEITASNIQSAIEALPGFGANNVRVINASTGKSSQQFLISYRNSLARKDLANAEIADSSGLKASSGQVFASIGSQTNPSPVNRGVAVTASNFKPFKADQTNIFYDQAQRGSLDSSKSSNGEWALKFHGGLTSTSIFPVGSQNNFYAVADTYFLASETGEVLLSGRITDPIDLEDDNPVSVGISFLASKNSFLPAGQIDFTTAKVTVVDRLTATPNNFTISEDSPQTALNVVSDDQDRFGSSRGIVSVTQPDLGGVVVIASGVNPQSVLFTPSKDFNGTSTFTYTIQNNLGDTATGIVSISVTPVNDAPVTKQSSFSMNEDSNSPISILPATLFSPGPENESGQKLNLSLLSKPPETSGIAMLNAQGALEFAPAKDFFGLVTFVVQAIDDGPSPPTPNPTATNTVTISVVPINDAPTALTIQPTVPEDATTPLVLAPAQVFSPGPSNEATQILSLEILAVPGNQQGSATLLPNGALQFIPAKDFFGEVLIGLRGTDNGSPALSTTTSLTINVTPVNDAPSLLKTVYEMEEDSTNPLVIEPSDVFTPGPSNEANQTVRFSMISGPSADQGTAVLDANGRLIFKPNRNYFGAVSIVMLGVDDGLAPPSPNPTTTATLTIQVSPVNDPPIIQRTSYTIAEDSFLPLVLLPNDLFLAGPENEASQTIALELLTNPTSEQGTAKVLPTGAIEFRPAADYFGNFTLAIRGTDNGSPNSSIISTVSINVTPVNDAPSAVDDTSGSNQLVAVVANGVQTQLDVLKNDSPGSKEVAIDNVRIKSLSVTTTPLGGKLTISQDRTFVDYTPPEDGINKTDSFSYTIEDSGGLTSTARAEVFLVPPTLPFARNDSYKEVESSTPKEYRFAVTNNDLLTTGSISRLLSISAPPTPDQGTARLLGAETPENPSDDFIVYISPAYFNGQAVLEYEMTDSAPGSLTSIGTVRITLTEVNDPPVAVSKSAWTDEDKVLTLSGSEFTKDMSRGPFEDSQSLRLLSVRSATPEAGAVTLVNGDIRFIPSLDFFGEALIEYTIQDNGKTNGLDDFKTSTSTLTIDVRPINDPPIAKNKELPIASVKWLEDKIVEIPIESILEGDLPGPGNESSQVVSLVRFNGTTPTAKGGLVQIEGGNLIYTPSLNFNSLTDGLDSFVYEIMDNGSPELKAEGTVRFRVQEVNDPPVARSLSRELFAGVATQFDLSDELGSMNRGAPNELGQVLRIKKITPPDGFQGNVTLDATGTVISFFAPIGTDQSIDLTYTVEDNGTTEGVSSPLTADGIIQFKVLPFQPSTIQGRLFIDDNRNGVFDTSSTGVELELPVGGVEVILSFPDPSNPSKSLSRIEMTRADGKYDFDLLPPSSYTISYSTPIGMTSVSDAARSRSIAIEAPGNKHFDLNFPLLGLQISLGSTIEYLSSGFYKQDGSLRSRGMYAVVNSSSGYSEWTSRKGGFESGYFYELVLNASGTQAYLSEIREDKQIYSTVLEERTHFVRTVMPDGNQVVRILASQSQLVWSRVDRSVPPFKARGYLAAIDDFFAQQDW